MSHPTTYMVPNDDFKMMSPDPHRPNVEVEMKMLTRPDILGHFDARSAYSDIDPVYRVHIDDVIERLNSRVTCSCGATFRLDSDTERDHYVWAPRLNGEKSNLGECPRTHTFAGAIRRMLGRLGRFDCWYQGQLVTLDPATWPESVFLNIFGLSADPRIEVPEDSDKFHPKWEEDGNGVYDWHTTADQIKVGDRYRSLGSGYIQRRVTKVEHGVVGRDETTDWVVFTAGELTSWLKPWSTVCLTNGTF